MAQVVVEYGLSSARASSVYAPGALRADQEGWVAQARRPSLDATAGWTARARGYGLRADELVPHENENKDNHNSPDPKHGSDQRATAALRTPFVQGVKDDRHARREGNAGGDPMTVAQIALTRICATNCPPVQLVHPRRHEGE
jgi:hypothetical protein